MKKSIVYQHKVYASITDLANAYGISDSTLGSRLRAGQSVVQAIDDLRAGIRRSLNGDRRRQGITLVFNNKTYDSIKSLANENGINPSVLRGWINAGYSTDDAVAAMLRGERREFGKARTEIEGVVYSSRKEAARSLKLTIGQVDSLRRGYSRLVNGVCVRNQKCFHNARSVVIDGRKFSTLTEAAAELNLSKSRIKKCVETGINESQKMHDDGYANSLFRDLFGELYVITNKVTGRRYVGITMNSHKDRVRTHLRRAKTDSKSLMFDDCQKFGVDKFKVTYVRKASMHDLRRLEKSYIIKHQTRDPKFGYNLAVGGVINSNLADVDKLKFDGMVYKNLASLCSTLDISLFRTRRLMREGMTLRRAVKEGQRWASLTPTQRKSEANRLVPNALRVKIGRRTLPFADACRDHGISYSKAYELTRSGLTPTQALRRLMRQSKVKAVT